MSADNKNKFEDELGNNSGSFFDKVFSDDNSFFTEEENVTSGDNADDFVDYDFSEYIDETLSLTSDLSATGTLNIESGNTEDELGELFSLEDKKEVYSLEETYNLSETQEVNSTISNTSDFLLEEDDSQSFFSRIFNKKDKISDVSEKENQEVDDFLDGFYEEKISDDEVVSSLIGEITDNLETSETDIENVYQEVEETLDETSDLDEIPTDVIEEVESFDSVEDIYQEVEETLEETSDLDEIPTDVVEEVESFDSVEDIYQEVEETLDETSDLDEIPTDVVEEVETSELNDLTYQDLKDMENDEMLKEESYVQDYTFGDFTEEIEHDESDDTADLELVDDLDKEEKVGFFKKLFGAKAASEIVEEILPDSNVEEDAVVTMDENVFEDTDEVVSEENADNVEVFDVEDIVDSAIISESVLDEIEEVETEEEKIEKLFDVSHLEEDNEEVNSEIIDFNEPELKEAVSKYVDKQQVELNPSLIDELLAEVATIAKSPRVDQGSKVVSMEATAKELLQTGVISIAEVSKALIESNTVNKDVIYKAAIEDGVVGKAEIVKFAINNDFITNEEIVELAMSSSALTRDNLIKYVFDSGQVTKSDLASHLLNSGDVSQEELASLLYKTGQIEMSNIVNLLIEKDMVSYEQIISYMSENGLVNLNDLAIALLNAGTMKIEDAALALLNSGTVPVDKFAHALYEKQAIDVGEVAKYLVDHNFISNTQIANILYSEGKISEEDIAKLMAAKKLNPADSKVIQNENSNLAIDFVQNFYELYNNNEEIVDFEEKFFNYYKNEIKSIIMQLNQDTADSKQELEDNKQENVNLKNKISDLETIIEKYIIENQKANDSLVIINAKNEALTSEIKEIKKEYEDQKILMDVLEKRILKGALNE